MREHDTGLVRACAVFALLLAGAGVHAVTAFTAALRRREIAIRALKLES